MLSAFKNMTFPIFFVINTASKYTLPMPILEDFVTANHEYDTSLWNRLVMGVADCIIYAGLYKIL